MAAEHLLKLARFVEHFKKSDLWKAMAACKEDSPWHREESVAIHTEMVCAEFDKIAERMTMADITYIVTYLSLLFHDTGKPPCKVVKFKPERGYYNAFHGHEPYSARLFEDYYVKNYKLFAGWLTPADAYKVMWMIENHLPYDYMGNDKKMDYLRTAMAGNLGEQWQGFGWHLLADTYGRISDDSAAKREKTETFVEMMNSANVNEPRFTEADAPTMLLLIGASGSGKSTYVKQKVAEGFAHFSYDDIRIELAKKNGAIKNSKDSKDEYRQAFAYCDKHRSEFGHYADVQFIKLVKDYRSIVVDNTNTSRKTRTKFVEAVKRRGYKIEAAVFPIDTDTLLARQHSRTDKTVPDDAVLRQYRGIQLPWVGVEVDKLHVMESNLVL